MIRRFKTQFAFVATLVVASAGIDHAKACQTAYKIDINTETAFSLVNTGKSQPSRVHLQGELAITPVTLQGKPGWWGMLVENMVVKHADSAKPIVQYSLPFAFKRGANGSIDAFWFSAAVDEQQQDMLKGLAYYFQGPTQLQTPISLNELDTLGRYSITYKPNADLIQTSKLSYIQLNDDNINQVDVLSSTSQYQPSSCWFNQKNGSEELVIYSNNRSMTLFSSQHYTLTKQPISNHTLFSFSTELTDWVTPTTVLTDAEKARLSEQLNALLALDLSQISAHELANKLKALDPVLDQLLDYIGSPQLSDAAQTRLMLALGKVDSQNSQNLLVNLLSTYPERPDIQFRSLRALTIASSTLDKSAIEKLAALVESGLTSNEPELQSNFYLTIGILAKSRAQADDLSEINHALENVLTTTLDENKQQMIIGAMGNTENIQHFESIKRFAISESNNQNTALRALGRLNKPQAKETLSSLLGRPMHEHTERALLAALSHYQLDQPIQTQVLNYLQSPSVSLKQAAISVLSQQSTLTASTKALLRKQIPLESDKKTVQMLINAIEKTQN